jgi:putative Mg2+ transporter-C (MgtC) family protein
LRLPLGILSGIGFIGAGAIVKRDDLVVGLTSAATIWFVTTIGLCLGGGQLGLGLAGLILALGTLSGLKLLEKRLPRHRHAHLRISAQAELDEDRMLAPLLHNRIRVVATGSAWNQNEASRTYSYKLSWKTAGEDLGRPAAINELASLSGVQQISLEIEGK